MSIDFEYEDEDGYFVDKKYLTKNESFISSTSEYLKNSFWNDFAENSKQETEEKLHEVLKSLNNTINLTINNSDGKEEILVAKYSDGKNRNDLLSNTFYVSPSLLLDSSLTIIESNEEYYSKLDALHGQVLLCSFMKKNVCASTATDYSSNKIWAIRNIFMTDLYALASNEVYESWPGFHSYVVQQQRVFLQDKKKIIDKIKKSEETKVVSFDDIVETLCYNRISLDKIDYSIFENSLRKIMEKADVLFNDLMNEKPNVATMFEKSKDIYKKLEELIKPYTFDKDEEVYSFDMSNSPLDRNLTGDNSYNNYCFVDGDIISGTTDHKEKIRETTSTLKYKLESDVFVKEKELLDKEYLITLPAVNKEDVLAYEKIVDRLKSNIRDVKNAFQFKNNVQSAQCHGLRDGYLDDNSLHKIILNDYEKMYYRKDIFESNEYHVTIAIDQTSSMRNKSKEAANLAIIMAEALSGIRNVYFSVYGFNTLNMKINTIVYNDKNYQKIEALSSVFAVGSTALGYHISAIADKINTQYNSIRKKIMFVITDGRPTIGSLQLEAVEHTANSVRLTRSIGIDVFGIGVMNAFSDAIGNKIFGSGQFAVINDIQSTLPLLVGKLKKYLQRTS